MIDFLVIGGGVAGVSAAARLAPHGSVTLLEAEEALAYHASGRSAAMFLESYGNKVVRALNEASADYLRTAHGGVLSPRPMMLLGAADEATGFAAQAADMGLKRIGLDEAATLWPLLDRTHAAHAAWRDDTCDLDTDLFIQNFLREARGAGAQVVTRARVSAIARDGSGWRVTAGGATHVARHIVNAAGAWADTVARMAGVTPLGIQPFRRSMARIALPEGMNPANWAFVDGVGDNWYAKPDAGALIVSPGEEDPMDPQDAWADDMILAEGLARYQEFSTAPVARMLANWAGLRSFAPDRALVIGPDAAAPGFLWLAGQGGYGFQTAAAASALLAQLATGTPTTLDATTVAALSPARFAR
ncbi:FAD-binding oxidoreductase [Lutimaribacter sp. EGI FJ00015]|uniref:FAD-binding oxidoreductase n=1 Tax=Lutimaribacter degradans TaxID=2945989 RepID=A0ACC5ZX92_9RHOB|nr:FAD-dependent oxidoreductase [Lutimaribacter sp. EGI FJ00013]MCM2562942.1 FAD-binding oxidoreductase [Lutimaribacter sp. EGI FJ00013]MCO0614110.1 FAD-binding oxidoreductase [Lutimaribacter sp. EGI FJ00015]MCO0636087.1 FAD-binding oxidoreductase [Lutimaribacter sp. EGI FJ00014]